MVWRAATVLYGPSPGESGPMWGSRAVVGGRGRACGGARPCAFGRLAATPVAGWGKRRAVAGAPLSTPPLCTRGSEARGRSPGAPTASPMGISAAGCRGRGRYDRGRALGHYRPRCPLPAACVRPGCLWRTIRDAIRELPPVSDHLKPPSDARYFPEPPGLPATAGPAARSRSDHPRSRERRRKRNARRRTQIVCATARLPVSSRASRSCSSRTTKRSRHSSPTRASIAISARAKRRCGGRVAVAGTE